MTTPAGTPFESAVTPAAPMLVLDRKSNGRAIYDHEAKRALVQQCLQRACRWRAQPCAPAASEQLRRPAPSLAT